jgi:hypothetical protein
MRNVQFADSVYMWQCHAGNQQCILTALFVVFYRMWYSFSASFLPHSFSPRAVLRDARTFEAAILEAGETGYAGGGDGAAKLSFLQAEVVSRISTMIQSRCAPTRFWPYLLLLW